MSCHLLELCFFSELADDRAWGILSHVHFLDGQRRGQRVAPDAEDPSNPQVQSWHVKPRLRPQGERVRGGTNWGREREGESVSLFLPFSPSFTFYFPSCPPPLHSALKPSFLPSFLLLTFPLSSPPPALSLSLVIGGGGRRICRNSSCCSSRGRKLIDRCRRGGATRWRGRGKQSLDWNREKEVMLNNSTTL